MCGYLRVSRADRSRSERLGLDAQRAAIVDAAESKGWEIVDWFEDDGFPVSPQTVPGSSPRFDCWHAHVPATLMVLSRRNSTGYLGR